MRATHTPGSWGWGWGWGGAVDLRNLKKYSQWLCLGFGGCYRLNSCVPPKSVCWFYLEVRLWGGNSVQVRSWEWSSCPGMRPLIRERVQSSLPKPPVYRHRKKATVCKPERELSSNAESASLLSLELPASKGGTKVSFLSHSVYDILLWKPKQKETLSNHFPKW